jgi:heme-degrading monooxygenase HmoA
MFARNVAIHLKPNTLDEFKLVFAKEVVPMLRKQTGFQDEITFSTPNGNVIAISLWDTKEHAEAYNTTAYPQVLKSLGKVLDGAPRVRISDVISSTLHPALSAVA